MDRKNRFFILDRYRRKFFIKSEIKKKILFSTLRNNQNSFITKQYQSFFIQKISLISNRSRIKNRCLVSARGYNTVKNIKVSRFIMRKNIYNANLMGWRKF